MFWYGGAAMELSDKANVFRCEPRSISRDKYFRNPSFISGTRTMPAVRLTIDKYLSRNGILLALQIVFRMFMNILKYINSKSEKSRIGNQQTFYSNLLGIENK